MRPNARALLLPDAPVVVTDMVKALSVLAAHAAHAGEMVMLSAPSGCGKTSALAVVEAAAPVSVRAYYVELSRGLRGGMLRSELRQAVVAVQGPASCRPHVIKPASTWARQASRSLDD